jgi:YesN/AraC family two-component response regulator
VPIDLVVTDVNMRGDRNGYDVVSCTKLMRPSVKTVIISGRPATPYFGRDMQPIVPDLFLSKPITDHESSTRLLLLTTGIRRHAAYLGKSKR